MYTFHCNEANKTTKKQKPFQQWYHNGINLVACPNILNLQHRLLSNLFPIHHSATASHQCQHFQKNQQIATREEKKTRFGVTKVRASKQKQKYTSNKIKNSIRVPFFSHLFIRSRFLLLCICNFHWIEQGEASTQKKKKRVYAGNSFYFSIFYFST